MGQLFNKHFVEQPQDLDHAGTLFGGTMRRTLMSWPMQGFSQQSCYDGLILLSLAAAVPTLSQPAQSLASGYFGSPTRSTSENLSIKRLCSYGRPCRRSGHP